MNQYLLTFISEFKLGFEYRGGFFLFALLNIVSTLASIFLWIYVFNTTSISSVLTKDQIIVYFFLTNVFLTFSASRVKLFSESVRTGELSNILVKPTSVILRLFAINWGYAFAKNLPQIPLNLLIVFMVVLLTGVKIEPINILLVLILIPFIMVLSFSFFSIFSMLSFWTTDNSAFIQIISNFSNLISGRWIPLFFLPATIQNIIKFFPFSYFIYFPVMLVLGEVSIDNYFKGIIFMLVQIIVFSCITYFLYLKGIKKYEGYGI